MHELSVKEVNHREEIESALRRGGFNPDAEGFQVLAGKSGVSPKTIRNAYSGSSKLGPGPLHSLRQYKNDHSSDQAKEMLTGVLHRLDLQPDAEGFDHLAQQSSIPAELIRDVWYESAQLTEDQFRTIVALGQINGHRDVPLDDASMPPKHPASQGMPRKLREEIAYILQHGSRETQDVFAAMVEGTFRELTKQKRIR